MIGAAPTLDTERLRLRQFRESDLESYAAMCADPEVMRYLGGKTWGRAECWRHLSAMLGHWQLRGFGLYAVEVRATGEFAGRVGFIHPESWPGFEVGWTLARPMWGLGYATEAARACLQHAFGPMQRKQVISVIHPQNHASRKVAERIGETLAGRTRLPGVDDAVDLYAINRPDTAWTPPDLPPCRSIDQVMKTLYRSISGPAGPRDWTAQRCLFHPDARLMRAGVGTAPWLKPMDLENFIQDASTVLNNRDHYAVEIARRIHRFGNIAQVRSVFESRTQPDRAAVGRRGVNLLQLHYDGERWWILNLLWDKETPPLHVPDTWLQQLER